MGRRVVLLLGSKNNQLMLYFLLACAFLLCWFLLTLLILFAQEKVLGSVGPARGGPRGASADDDTYVGRGIQLVVGHFNGNLPGGLGLFGNLSTDDLNANLYDPQPGLGENGRAVNLDDRDEFKADRTFGINQFNLFVSDRIALNRSLPDVRRAQCREKAYPLASELPTTSVIIVYHNEAFSTLARTVMSVINRSPRETLREIILVDDFSNRTFLRTDLEHFVIGLDVRVKLIRARTRVGLIRARLMGAQEADAEVLTFLDSHCECTEGWLEPLLARIKENRKAVVCPIIDVINDRTFAYQKGIELFRGGFNWNLQFRWYAVPPKIAKQRAKDPTAPIASPTMAGGLFSIDRLYFEQLGAYDFGMDIWGAENIEISFRIWQCGGRVEILPCSHVGHIFRKASPHDFPAGSTSGRVLNANLARLAEVWMDEWKHLFYRTAPQAASFARTLDVSDRVELRKQLACKDFGWYLENVWPEHFLPRTDAFFGRLVHRRSLAERRARWCLAWALAPSGGYGKTVSLSGCYMAPNPGQNSTQENGTKENGSGGAGSLPFRRTELWVFTAEGQLKSDEHQCLSAIEDRLNHGKWAVQLKECGEHDTEFWTYNSYYRQMVHKKSGLCLDEPEIGSDVLMVTSYGYFGDPGATAAAVPTVRNCRRAHFSQQWELHAVDWLPTAPSMPMVTTSRT